MVSGLPIGVCLDGDDRKIDLRQRRDRQLPIAEQAAEHDADRQQGDAATGRRTKIPEKPLLTVPPGASVELVAPRPRRSPSRSKNK